MQDCKAYLVVAVDQLFEHQIENVYCFPVFMHRIDYEHLVLFYMIVLLGLFFKTSRFQYIINLLHILQLLIFGFYLFDLFCVGYILCTRKCMLKFASYYVVHM